MDGTVLSDVTRSNNLYNENRKLEAHNPRKRSGQQIGIGVLQGNKAISNHEEIMDIEGDLLCV